jgi:hypothetical protein
MSDNYESSDRIETHSAIIKVIGVGSGGINAVTGMLSKLEGVEFWAIDTDVTNSIDRTPILNALILPSCYSRQIINSILANSIQNI